MMMMRSSCCSREGVGNSGVMLCMSLGEESSFSLEKAVCNHGFFMMAPNLWIPSTKTLQRPLRLADGQTSIQASISHPHPPGNSIHIHLHGTTDQFLAPKDERVILAQVARMLRLSDRDETDVQQFHQMHPEAKKKGFGRIFRAPTIFEDMVKTILLCSCSWPRSLQMAQSLCELQLDHLKKMRGGASNINDYQAASGDVGNFPNSVELSILEEETLRRRCNLGYRARTIIELAKRCEDGSIKLNQLEKLPTPNEEKIFRIMNKQRGFGPFACANVLMCAGYYKKIPIDTETFRHLREIHGRRRKEIITKKDVEEIYSQYAPFQCMAYWFELCEYYERRYGKLSELPRSKYHTVSGSYKI